LSCHAVFHVWLVWRIGSGIGHMNKVYYCVWWTTFGGSTIPVFSRPTQPGHPSEGAMNTGGECGNKEETGEETVSSA